ncbi:adult enhancer factor 1-like isoform X2 [Spea bombifrons]|nr:adult enhancer factor 1-like isoform X2 [Spea bombifrons]
MDTEHRKKNSTGFKFVKQKSNIAEQKNLLGNQHVKLNTGKFLKKKASSGEPKCKTCPESSWTVCSLTSREQEQGESGILHLKESDIKWINKYSEKKWTHMEHIKNMEISNTHDSEIIAKAKKLPFETRNVGHLLLPQTNILNVSRVDVKQNLYHPFHAKDSAPTISQLAKVQGSKHTLTTETILHGHDGDLFEESACDIEIPFCQPHNNIPDPKSSVQPIDKMHKDLYDKHFISYRDMPSVNTKFENKDTNNNVSFRTTVSTSVTEHKEIKIRRSSPSQDKEKVETIVNKQKDKPAENSIYRRFLLIDSQGLPYTVVVEEPKSVKTSNLYNQTNLNSSFNGASKSLAPRKVYTCPVCFRIFEYFSYLQRHSIAHSQQKPHLCKICGKAFKRTSHLTRHKYTHFRGKPFQCQICQHTCRDMRELTRHKQIHTGEKHQCDVCYMNFSDCSSLQCHISYHTTIISGDTELK